MKKTYSFILRISITLALLIFLFFKTDLASLFKIVSESDPAKLLLAFFVFLFLILLVFLRWHLLLEGLAIKVKLGRLILSYLSANFFNLVLPSTIGGDAVRTLDISNHTGTHSSGVLATVLLDRLAGFFGLITILSFALISGHNFFSDITVLLVAVILLFLASFLAGIMFCERFFHIVFMFLPFKKVKEYLYKIHQAAASYKRKKRVLAVVWFLSVLAQAGMCVVFYFLAQAIHIQLDLIYFLMFVPVITAFSVIPISLGGLGVRDTASVFFFAKVGLAAEKAFALSLMFFGFLIIVGVAGGASYVFTLYRRRL